MQPIPWKKPSDSTCHRRSYLQDTEVQQPLSRGGTHDPWLCWHWPGPRHLSLFSHPVTPDSLQPHGLQHARLPCPSPSPGVCSNSCPLSRESSPTISSSVVSFSSCPQSFPESGFFPMSRCFTSGGQSIGASASVLPMNIQGSFPLRLSGLISLQFKGLSRIFFSIIIWKHQFFISQPSLWSDSYIHTWLLEKP